jgi:hypothetical protein
MTNTSGANHVGNRRLRVLRGGAPLPIEWIASRRAAVLHAGILLRVGGGVLTLAFLLLTVILATYEFERVRGLALPLIGLCAGLLALAMALLTQALSCVRRLDQRRTSFKPELRTWRIIPRATVGLTVSCANDRPGSAKKMVKTDETKATFKDGALGIRRPQTEHAKRK